MTLAQLQSFVLVARHGSVKAAAAELEVTEPAVSVAVGALRRELGDDLFVRIGRGIALTAGGRRLAAPGERDPRASPSRPAGRCRTVPARRAALRVGDDRRRRRAHRPAHRRVRRARRERRDRGRGGGGRELRRPARAPARRHHARPAAGPRARGDDRSVPFLRCRLIVVAAPGAPARRPPRASRRRRSARRALARRAARRRPVDGVGRFWRAQRAGAARRRRLREPRGRDRGGRGGRGRHAGAEPLRPRRGARGARSSRSTCAGTPVDGAVAREHAGAGPRAAGRAGAAALRDHARGDPGDVRRARRDDVGPRRPRCT